jgi:hypothetical protein
LAKSSTWRWMQHIPPKHIYVYHTNVITFQPAASSSAVPWQRLLTLENLQLHAFMFYLHCFPCRTQFSADYWQFPGWRPVHTNLLVFSSHADFQLNSETRLPILN